MKNRCLLLLLITLLVIPSAVDAKVIKVKPGKKLQKVINKAAPGDTLFLREGIYTTKPITKIDTLCGNCLEEVVPHLITIGFYIDKPLHLIGESRTGTILKTGAGYGIFFDGARMGTIENLTITGGVRDTVELATDGGVVARNTELKVCKLNIIGNDDLADGVVVGICGVVGREGSNIRIEGCVIAENGWDGVALYRGARAFIIGNMIRDGRGAGVGITWDAVAEVRANEIHHYWKGIGTFGTSTAVVQDNIVRDLRGWGIVATGESVMDCSHNIIARTGNCGFSIWSEEAKGRFINNVVFRAGREEEWICPRVGVWWNGPDDAFEAHHNVVWGSEEESWRRSYWDDDPAGDSTEPLENMVVPSDTAWNGIYCEVDPLYNNPELNDFRPTSESPLLKNGIHSGHPGNMGPVDIGLRSGAYKLIDRAREVDPGKPVINDD